MFRFFKEIYFTAFAIFFRVGGVDWTPTINAGKSVVCIALIESAFILGVVGWIEIFFKIRFFVDLPNLAIVIAFFILCAANHYPLVALGHGITFEREFKHLKTSRKIFLLTICITMILAVIAFFIYSGFVHRSYIGINNP
jgi:hypothetical protein